jgi:molybdopterin-binding protein
MIPMLSSPRKGKIPADVAEDTSNGGAAMALSARNQLRGVVRSVNLGDVMAEVTVDVGGQELVSAITRGSAEALDLAEGQEVTVVIKATEVLIATDD